MQKIMDGKSDAWTQRQKLRSTSNLKGMKSNIHKKGSNRGRNSIKGKAGQSSSNKSKPAFEYNLENFPRLGETNNLSKVVKKKTINARCSTQPPTHHYDYNVMKNESHDICHTSSPTSPDSYESLSQYIKRVNKKSSNNISTNTYDIFQEDYDKNKNNSKKKIKHEKEDQNKKENDESWIINTEPIIATVLRSNTIKESSNTILSENAQDNADFEVYKPKSARKRNSSVCSDHTKYMPGHRARNSSVSSDRARHSSVSSDTSYASRLSFSTDVPDNWESRDSTASPGDLQPQDIKLPVRLNNNKLIEDGLSLEHSKENVSQKMAYPQGLDDFMDIELPYKPKLIKLTEQEKENLKYIRPMTYQVCNRSTVSTSNNKEFKSSKEKNAKPSSSLMNGVMKSSEKKIRDRKPQDVIHPLHTNNRSSSDECSSNSNQIRRNNLRNNESFRHEKIGNDFLNQRSFLLNDQTGQIKHLENISKNPRKTSSEFWQSGYNHSWDPDTFCRPREIPQKVQNFDWRRKSCSPSILSSDEDDYYYGNIPYEIDSFGSDCGSSPRSVMSPHNIYSSSRSSSFDCTTPTSLADMLNLHSSSPCTRDPNRNNSPYQIHNGYLGSYPCKGLAYTEGSPTINSGMLSPEMDMITQFQIPEAYLLPGFETSSQLLDSSLSFATYKNLSLYEDSLNNLKNISKQQNEKNIWFNPIMEKENIWA